jgi:hypothetical protein
MLIRLRSELSDDFMAQISPVRFCIGRNCNGVSQPAPDPFSSQSAWMSCYRAEHLFLLMPALKGKRKISLVESKGAYCMTYTLRPQNIHTNNSAIFLLHIYLFDYLFICLLACFLSSTSANYEISLSKETSKISIYKQIPWPLVRERTIPTDDRHLSTKFSANICG